MNFLSLHCNKISWSARVCNLLFVKLTANLQYIQSLSLLLTHPPYFNRCFYERNSWKILREIYVIQVTDALNHLRCSKTCPCMSNIYNEKFSRDIYKEMISYLNLNFRTLFFLLKLFLEFVLIVHFHSKLYLSQFYQWK